MDIFHIEYLESVYVIETYVHCGVHPPLSMISQLYKFFRHWPSEVYMIVIQFKQNKSSPLLHTE